MIEITFPRIECLKSAAAVVESDEPKLICLLSFPFLFHRALIKPSNLPMAMRKKGKKVHAGYDNFLLGCDFSSLRRPKK